MMPVAIYKISIGTFSNLIKRHLQLIRTCSVGVGIKINTIKIKIGREASVHSSEQQRLIKLISRLKQELNSKSSIHIKVSCVNIISVAS